MNYKQHPLSAAFPAMHADEYQALCDSIGNIGVQNPVTLFEGMVIDGWHRYTAAKSQFLECPMIELGSVDPRDFVIAQNNSRRNLTPSQRAMAVTSVYGWHSVGKISNCAPVHNNNKTGKELAALAGVSLRTINDAKTAQKSGFTEAVKAGAITVKEAASIATGTIATPKQAPEIMPVTIITNEPEYTETDALHEQISDLQASLVVANMGDASDEEKTQASALIAELRAQIKTLEATNKALIISRDSYQNEVSQLKNQCAMQRKMLDKMKA